MSAWGSSWRDSWGSAWGAEANADVKVSWMQFDSQATPCDVKVSWLELNTNASQYDVKVSWVQFDTQATPCDVRVCWLQFNTNAVPVQDSKSGVNRLFYYKLQEKALEEKAERAKPMPYVEPYQVKELADGSAVIILDEVRKRSKVAETVDKKSSQAPLSPAPAFMQDYYVQSVVLELRNLVTQHKNLTVQYRNEINVANDEEDDIELLLLVA